MFWFLLFELRIWSSNLQLVCFPLCCFRSYCTTLFLIAYSGLSPISQLFPTLEDFPCLCPPLRAWEERGKPGISSPPLSSSVRLSLVCGIIPFPPVCLRIALGWAEKGCANGMRGGEAGWRLQDLLHSWICKFLYSLAPFVGPGPTAAAS